LSANAPSRTLIASTAASHSRCRSGKSPSIRHSSWGSASPIKPSPPGDFPLSRVSDGAGPQMGRLRPAAHQRDVGAPASRARVPPGGLKLAQKNNHAPPLPPDAAEPPDPQAPRLRQNDVTIEKVANQQAVELKGVTWAPWVGCAAWGNHRRSTFDFEHLPPTNRCPPKALGRMGPRSIGTEWQSGRPPKGLCGPLTAVTREPSTGRHNNFNRLVLTTIGGMCRPNT
jgi:hypothetical protein